MGWFADVVLVPSSRVKYLKEIPYTHAEADAATGRGVLKFEEFKEKAAIEAAATEFFEAAVAPVKIDPDVPVTAEMDTDVPVEDAAAVNEDEIL